jgi:Ca2+-binding EF-hand superfamily protein
MRLHRTLGAAALVAAGLALAGASRPERALAAGPAVKIDDETYKVVYLGDARPVLLEVRVGVGGRSLRAAWEGMIDQVFRYLDIDGDGVISKAEAERAPPLEAIVGGAFTFGRRGPMRTLAALPRDGKITRAQLADYYRSAGLAPFQLAGGGRPNFSGVVVLTLDGRMGGRPSPEAMTARLFELLDKDKDGKLSRQELADAPRVLARLDRNDDEMITPEELLPNAGGGNGYAVAFAPNGRLLAGQGELNAFHLVQPGRGADRALAQRLLAKYAKKGAKFLSRADLGLDEKTFAALDRDGDGTLDAEELARFAQRRSDLALVTRLGKRGGKAAVELADPNAPLAKMVRKDKEGNLALEMGNTRVELTAPPEPNERMFFDIKAQYRTQFRMADKDNNGYLDKKEAEASPFFRNLFAVMDRDGDGMLFEKEMLAYVDQIAVLQKAALTATVSLSIASSGQGLFDLIDTDKDGRLSVRELRNAVKLLDKLDRDGDGKLSRQEIPRTYRATFRQGPANSPNQGFRAVVVNRSYGMGGPRVPNRAAGPLWFRKMDRNRDGDVSRREFLGTDEEFKKIDTDGDGLISVAEAEAYDRKMRKKEE